MRWLILALTLTLAGAASADPGYRAGLLYPADARSRDAALGDFYARWKAMYLTEGCGPGRAYVSVTADGKQAWGGSEARTITVSEAHGYGMLILALMAGADPDAHRLFDAMLAYRDDHPAASDPGLMAWDQVIGCANAGAAAGGDHSATDGDLDIAFALLLADRRWSGPYGARADQVLAATLAHVRSGAGDFLTIGDWARDDPTYGSATRTSDFMPSHFRAFAARDPGWTRIIDRTYAAFDAAGSSRTGPVAGAVAGLVPDFITGLPDQPHAAPPGFLEGEGDGALSWNAVRVPWRLALDDIFFADPRAHDRLVRLNRFLRAATAGDPAKISDGYALDGRPLHPGQDGGMAFAAMFAVAAMTAPASDPKAQAWLDALWSRIITTPVAADDYYGNTLKLLAMITLTGHWRQP